MLNYRVLFYRICRILSLIFVSFSSACPAGWYGQDCEQVALCGEEARSDPVTGRCVCKISHQGEDCGQGLSFHNSVFLMIMKLMRWWFTYHVCKLSCQQFIYFCLGVGDDGWVERHYDAQSPHIMKVLGPFCAGFTCPPCTCLLPQVLRFPPTILKQQIKSTGY